MGQQIRQPTAATVLALGGIPIKSSPVTLVLTTLAVACGALVVATLAMEADMRWVNAAIGAACAVAFLATVSKALEVVGHLLDRHADRIDAITQAHSQDMRRQVLSLNWLTASQAGGRERARIEATLLYGADGPTDTGPFRVANGAG